MDPTVLFTHLKIILLKCFQFSVFSFQFSATISSIQTDPINKFCTFKSNRLGHMSHRMIWSKYPSWLTRICLGQKDAGVWVPSKFRRHTYNSTQNQIIFKLFKLDYAINQFGLKLSYFCWLAMRNRLLTCDIVIDQSLKVTSYNSGILIETIQFNLLI